MGWHCKAVPDQPAPKPTRTKHAGQFRPGQSGNPAGRPKVGESLASAMRHKFPPDRICELAEKLATTAESDQVRLSALQFIAERGHGKVTTVIDAAVNTTSSGSSAAGLTHAQLVEHARDLAARVQALPPPYEPTPPAEPAGDTGDAAEVAS